MPHHEQPNALAICINLFVTILPIIFKNCFKTCHLRHTTSVAMADMAGKNTFTIYLIMKYTVITKYKIDLIKKYLLVW